MASKEIKKPQFDSNQRTGKYQFEWGTVTVGYAVRDNRLTITVLTENRSAHEILGVSYEVLQFRFPAKPSNYDGNTPILGFNMGGPTMLPIRVGAVTMVLGNDDVRRPLILGLPWALDKPKSTIFPLRINSDHEPMYPNSVPAVQRPIAPGKSDTYEISLSFGPASIPPEKLAAHILDKFTQAYPPVLDWKDKRAIGQLILAKTASGWPKNPRGWFLDQSIDVTTPAGIASFHEKVLEWADRSVGYLRDLNAQGMITWDIEGQQYPQPTTYVGDPRLTDKMAPEMAGVADRYFRKFRDAGFRVGVCVRPQRFVAPTGAVPAKQMEVEDVAQNLIDKIRYAHDRWGATLFYIDSNGDPGAPMDIDIMQKVARTFPDVLLVPEHKNLAYYSVSAPYAELRSGVFATPADVLRMYPKAFSVLNVTDGLTDAAYGKMQTAVERGDLLMGRAWFADPAIDRVRALYSYVK